jgi:hypothetical protein
MQDVASKRNRLLQCSRVIAIVKALFYFNLDFDDEMKKRNEICIPILFESKGEN